MGYRRTGIAIPAFFIVILLVLGTSCNTTRRLKEDQYLLRSNTIKFESSKNVNRKAEIKDNLEALTMQKPNTYVFGLFPLKLWLYNSRIEKKNVDTLTGKSVQPPVIYDSSTIRRSVLNMKSYLFHEGYFYADVDASTKLKNKKAYVTYHIKPGTNYLINNAYYDIDDSAVNDLLNRAKDETFLKKNEPFTYDLLDAERVRITNVLRNWGYYYMSNSNISFELDTVNKQYLTDIDNPFANAVNFISLQKEKKKPTLDIKVIIRRGEDPKAYTRYGIGRIRVFPDYRNISDIRDSSMHEETIKGTVFRYHNYYVHADVLYKHIQMRTGRYYRQEDYDQTITRLNDLGIFQSVRVFVREDTNFSNGPTLNVAILMTPTDRYDLSPSVEVSTGGNIYQAGAGASLSLRNRNVGKGANLLTVSTNVGVEYITDSTANSGFSLLNRRLGGNATLDFPKFLLPGGNRILTQNNNAPRTLLGAGISLQDRVQYFTLINTSANLTYRWRETETKTWEITPAFVSLVRIPKKTPEFEARLKSSDFLRNTYRNTFIEGQNVTFIYSNVEKNAVRDYSYIKASGEEAGGLINGLRLLFPSIDTQYSNYFKLDLDLQHFFRRPHSTIALRFYSGIGIPYGGDSTLPYIKQYFAGGPFSLRGWQSRRLGPGSSDAATSNTSFADRTGDIKLEANAEYRFDIAKIFAGAAQLNGAFFVDAGNIWLAKPSGLKEDGTPEFPNGTLVYRRFWQDIAMNTGIGLRIDVASLLVVRVDMALRVKDPSRPEVRADNGWLFKADHWPFDRMYLSPQFALGYPF